MILSSAIMKKRPDVRKFGRFFHEEISYAYEGVRVNYVKNWKKSHRSKIW